MAEALRFVLSSAPPEASDPLRSWSDLVRRQAESIQHGQALRIYRCPDTWTGDLQTLVADGLAAQGGDDPFAGASEPQRPGNPLQRRLACDALIPVFDPARQWLEVYRLEDPDTEDSAVQRLDSLSVQEASNETCWFYPTEDGQYLSWQNEASIRCQPGHVFGRPSAPSSEAYNRDEIKVLWSLMADEQELTCVGFTYQRRHIDFALIESAPSPASTWTSFVVDSISPTPLRTFFRCTVKEHPSTG